MSALHSNSQLLSSLGPPAFGLVGLPLRPEFVEVRPFMAAVVPLWIPCTGFMVPPDPLISGGTLWDPQSGLYSIPGSNCINTKTCKISTFQKLRKMTVNIIKYVDTIIWEYTRSSNTALFSTGKEIKTHFHCSKYKIHFTKCFIQHVLIDLWPKKSIVGRIWYTYVHRFEVSK